MGYFRVTWGMSAAVWTVVIVLGCIWWGWSAAAVAVVFGLLPDLTLIGAGSGERGRIRPSRVAAYNAMHSLYLPLPIAAVGVVVFIVTGGYESGVWQLALAGLAWFVHIAVDRACGFGLRAEDGTVIPVR